CAFPSTAKSGLPYDERAIQGFLLAHQSETTNACVHRHPIKRPSTRVFVRRSAFLSSIAICPSLALTLRRTCVCSSHRDRSNVVSTNELSSISLGATWCPVYFFFRI
ncbi:unnamed protein product, partial [Ectocarpus fasciculatus]